MAKSKKVTKERDRKSKRRFSIDGSDHDELEEQELPSDEAGRLKVKKNYAELLGIRIEKLKGRVLNREKINKSIEGVYFICVDCKKVCHSLDEGLVQEAQTLACFCSACAKIKGIKELTGPSS